MERRRLRVDLEDLALAFEGGQEEARDYLDLETGEVVTVTDEARRELEEIAEEANAEALDAEALAAALRRRDLPERMREFVQAAALVEAGFGARLIEIPRDDPSEAYRDMEDFIGIVGDGRLQDRLWQAIRGRGAFRRFKDLLADHPREEERWFTFRDGRARRRLLKWLESEGVEPLPK